MYRGNGITLKKKSLLGARRAFLWCLRPQRAVSRAPGNKHADVFYVEVLKSKENMHAGSEGQSKRGMLKGRSEECGVLGIMCWTSCS